MTRRPLRPHFGPMEKDALLKVMSEARQRALLAGGAAGYASPRWQLCDELRKVIDALATDLTGDPSYFHLKPGGSP
jgi:hypothetical protein